MVVSLLLAFIPHFAFVVCVAVRISPGLVDYDPMQLHCCIDLYWLYHCCVRLLPIKFAFAVCVAVRISLGLVDYDPMQLHCCIDLYWLYHCCVHLLPSSLLLLCVWLFAFYLAWLIMTPRNFIAAYICIGCIIAACIYSHQVCFCCVCGCSHFTWLG